MNSAHKTFYILHGDDALRIEEELSRLCAALGGNANADLNMAVFDGSSADLNDILGAALAFPFLAEARIVVVKGLLAHLTRKGAGAAGRKALERVTDQLGSLPDWCRLILVEQGRIDDRSKVLQLARDHAQGQEMFYPVPKDLTPWIIKRAQDNYGAIIEPRAAAALASVTQPDIRTADNELAKLAAYVTGERAINEADVALLTPYVSEANMFDLVDAIAEGRAQHAIGLLHRLLSQQEDIFSLYGMIVRQFRLLLLAKEHLVGGGSPKDLAQALGIHHYPAEKLARQSRAFQLADLERIFRALQEYDLRIKTGRIKPHLALDLLIAQLGR